MKKLEDSSEMVKMQHLLHRLGAVKHSVKDMKNYFCGQGITVIRQFTFFELCIEDLDKAEENLLKALNFVVLEED